MRMKLLASAGLAFAVFFLAAIYHFHESLAAIALNGLGSGETPQAESGAHGLHPAGESEHSPETEPVKAHSDHHHPQHKLLVTSPLAKAVTLTERYVCQIHSRRHIEIRALEEGYLETVSVAEGQTVKEGDLMFSLVSTLYQAGLDADLAEAQLAQVELANTKKLVSQNIVSVQELKLAEAKLAKAQAKVERARAELAFASIRAPFDGIVDRLHEQTGSLVEEGTVLTTLSDNQVMWVYFNVPEARYLEYQEVMQQSGNNHNNLSVELKLANHQVFPQAGKIGAIEAEFNNETGNIAFRADFPNPHGLLRHGQTGTVLIHHIREDAIVIPQRATFEILAKTYVYVVGEDDVIHQREITVEDEQEDIFLVEGVTPNEKIVLEGLRQVREGDTAKYEFQSPELVMSNLKYHAE